MGDLVQRDFTVTVKVPFSTTSANTEDVTTVALAHVLDAISNAYYEGDSVNITIKRKKRKGKRG